MAFRARLRLLLEGVKHIDGSLVPQRVDGAERIAAVVRDNLHHPCSAEAGEGFCVPMLASPLREIKGIAHMILYGLRELAQILAARPHPDHGFER